MLEEPLEKSEKGISSILKPLVRQKVDILSHSISFLYESVEHLESRLKPILRVKAEKPKSDEEVKKPFLLADELQILDDRIKYISYEIEEIMKRLEI